MGARPDRRIAHSTQERILDAAESLFIENGFAATSLRAIASAAAVNLAATHYHFGSKQGLLAAVFHRRIQPIDRARIAALDELEAADTPLTVRAIVGAFLSPLRSPPEEAIFERLPNLIGRIMGEPESLVTPLLKNEFAEAAQRYQLALSRALPHLSSEDIQWRFHFMIGAMIQLLRFPAPLMQASGAEHFKTGTDHLIDFVVAGLTQESTS